MWAIAKKDFKDVSNKINKSLQLLIILVIPMTVGLSFLAYPVWNAFYGYNAVGIDVLRIYVFLALTLSFQSILVESAQIMNNTKLTLGSLILGVIIKLVLNVPMIHLFDYIGLQGYYGPTVASIISQLITIVFLLFKLNRKYQVNYSETIKILGKTLVATIFMVGALILLNLIFPVDNSDRNSKIYVVQKGDTLWSISRMFNVSINDIRKSFV